ncbi:MAG: phytoene desaturase family protein [Bacteroidota bacterium]|jgi:diapolycopene oxygenase
MSAQRKKIIVIGAGLGGMSASISLAAAGYEVEIFEKNEKVGGKLNILHKDGFTFDMGPSILTLPQIFEDLFARAGESFADSLPLRDLDPQWRNFFEDGSTFDLFFDKEKMRGEVRRFDPSIEKGFFEFIEYSGRQYDFIEKGYFKHGLDTIRDFARFYPLSDMKDFDLLRTMHQSTKRFIKNPKVVDVMDYFIKYVGSSALVSPGFMNLMPTIQFRFKLWYIDGGMYHLAAAMRKLLDKLGVRVHLGAEVTRILKQGRTLSGIELRGGEQVMADYIVSNMETLPAYEKLLGEDAQFMSTLKRFEPACSGLILDLGVKRRYPQLAHHNFFFSKDQRKHFNTVFKKHELPQDPTIYLVAASRSDPTVAPEGCENIKILPHIPYIDEENPLTDADYLAFKERVVDKLERMGLTDLRKNTITEHVWTPLDIQKNYYSNKGSIYGVACDRWKNFALKTPKRSDRYDNLFFVGGSVNPGGGMPMVTLCGQLVADKLIEVDRAGN